MEAFIAAFARRHALPAGFSRVVPCYLAALRWLLALDREKGIPIVGLCGAQGTGKSTLAAFLVAAAREADGLNLLSLSLDDFYLPRKKRLDLSRDVHPLLATRGVPGTHDLELLESTLRRALDLRAGNRLRVPVFDKATDDRVPESGWRHVDGSFDLIVLEGWCVGAEPQSEDALARPVNSLEADRDPDGVWRRWVNDQLAAGYRRLFACLDGLVFLCAPDMASVFRWRLEQEQKLGRSDGDRIMSSAEVRDFIGHYERITRHCLTTMPPVADVVLWLDSAHGCERVESAATLREIRGP